TIASADGADTAGRSGARTEAARTNRIPKARYTHFKRASHRTGGRFPFLAGSSPGGRRELEQGGPAMAQITYEEVNLMLRLYDMRREPRLRQGRAWFVDHFHPESPEEMMKR